ncbi:MAG: hypothetical protein PHE83_00300 [Opitutaceae bacterium]|nr:hypothetical protein [Opitutaceae bacterium]
MAYKKQYRLAQSCAKPAMELVPSPRSPKDVITILQLAARLGLADGEMVSHLAEMGALFPKELLGAFKAFRERRACDN